MDGAPGKDLQRQAERRMKGYPRKLLTTIIMMLAAVLVFAEEYDWARWRGPNGNGISAETGWRPAALEGGLKVAWSASVGQGYSSVSVADGRVFTMGNDGVRDTVYCFNIENGRKLWSYSYTCKTGMYPGTRATPTHHAGRLYTLSREGHLFCLNARTGAVVWKLHIGDELGMRAPEWGFAGSPLIYNNLLILNAGTSGLALEKDTGKVVWDSGPRGGGYSTPVVYRQRGRDLIAVLSNSALSGVEISDGKVVWTIDWGTVPAVNGADPVISGMKAFVATGYGKGSALIDFSSTPVVLWREPVYDTHFSSFVLVRGFLYGNDGDARSTSTGKFRCVDFETGDIKWSEQLGFGSLIAVDSYLIMLNSVGEIIIGEINPVKFVEVARGALPRNQYWSPPAFSHGRLFIRNLKGDLYCVDMR